MKNNKLIFFWLAVFLAVFMWSGIKPQDRLTWVLEVLPAVAGLSILAATYKYFQFTSLACWLMLIHAVILMVGGHYTYAQVPLFNWIRDAFELSRNHYDRVGHFAQGFVPAIIARELLIRKAVVKPAYRSTTRRAGRSGKWLFFIVLCICLAISAFYEFIEWWVALATGTAAEAFLGTQGDVWDTQSDMFMAFLGAVIALILLGRIHDRLLAVNSSQDRQAS